MRKPFRSTPASAVIGNDHLVVHSQEPFNVEPPVELLRVVFVTTQHHFYVRGDGPILVIDPAAYLLRVQGRVATKLELGLAELRSRFAPVTVVATLQCAGNHRAKMVGEMLPDEANPVTLSDDLDQYGLRVAGRQHSPEESP